LALEPTGEDGHIVETSTPNTLRFPFFLRDLSLAEHITSAETLLERVCQYEAASTVHSSSAARAPPDRRRSPPRDAQCRSRARRASGAQCRDCSAWLPAEAGRARASIPQAPPDRRRSPPRDVTCRSRAPSVASALPRLCCVIAHRSETHSRGGISVIWTITPAAGGMTARMWLHCGYSGCHT
jgi:hypothetical protein